MAQITVVYKDFDEMKAVARELLKNELSDETRGQAKAVVPIQSTPVQTVRPCYTRATGINNADSSGNAGSCSDEYTILHKG